MTTYTSEGKNLYLVRGVPGAGKSTFAKNLGCTHFETDEFFMVDGEYKFDPSRLKEAHAWCLDQVELAMIQNHTGAVDYSDIVVSNTFTQEWEMDPYFRLAESWGYRVFSIIVEHRHNGVNQHNVPDEKRVIMKERFEIKLM